MNRDEPDKLRVQSAVRLNSQSSPFVQPVESSDVKSIVDILILKHPVRPSVYA